MNANPFKKSRRGWAHLSACYRVCIWSRQSLGPRIFEVRVREGFVRRVGRARISAEYYSAHWRQKRRYRVSPMVGTT